MLNLPIEILEKIFKDLSIVDLSNMLCVSKGYYNKLNDIKFELMDSMDEIGIYIPKTKETHDEYKYCINWSQILFEEKHIPEYILELLSEYINFDCVSAKQKFSEDFIRKYYKNLSYSSLIVNQDVPLDTLIKIVEENNIDMLYWRHIWKNQNINIDFIDKYIEYVDWEYLSKNKNSIDVKIILKYGDNLNWSEITRHGISEFYIERYLNNIDMFSWYNISYYSKLSNDFILKYYSNLHINSIIHSQLLSEEVIYYMMNTIMDDYDIGMLWYKIALHQPISKSFILKHIDKLSLQLLIRNKHVKRSWLKQIYGNMDKINLY